MKNVKFSEGDVETILALTCNMKLALMFYGIRTITPQEIAALRLLVRISELMTDLTPEQGRQVVQELYNGRDVMNTEQELRFIMADMERRS